MSKQNKMKIVYKFAGIVGIVGVKQVSPALPVFDLCTNTGILANKGKAGETFALPLQNRMVGWLDGLIRQKLGGLGW